MINKKTFFLFLILILGLNLTYSNYYADIIIDVKDNGEISINGKTNFDEFKNITNSQLYTSKNAEFWVLNLSYPQFFDYYIYELILPNGAQINYIKTTQNMRIDEENNRIKIIGTDENRPFNLIVQYKINKTNEIESNNQNILFYTSLFFLISSIIILTFISINLNKKSKKNNLIFTNNQIENNQNNIQVPNNQINIENLPLRQKEIIELIIEHKKMTQKQLEEKMNIPKSSISRNVQSLVQKKILKKEKSGQSNYITLNQI